MSLIYPNHIQIQKPRRLIRTQRSQILEPQGSVWGVDFSVSNARIDCGNDASLSFSTAFTLIAKTFISSTGFATILGKHLGAPNRSYFFDVQGSKFRVTVSSNGTTVTTRTGATTPGANDLVTIAARYDGANTILDLFLNGDLDNAGLSGSIPASIKTNSANFNIGSNSVPSVFWDKQIEYVIAYNRALTNNEIKWISDHSQEEPEPNRRVGWWRLQEGSGFANGTQIEDSSVEQNHGSMQSFSSNPWVNIGVR